MADFVAVIRRAVDGLAKNTPEMREKVYDKARGAVRRQLENMKPAPPETMIHRQMEKLEAAILSVEAEHAEALPAEEPVEAPVFAPAPVYEEAPTEQPATAEVYESESAVPAQWPEDGVAAQPVAEDVYAAPAEPQTASSDAAAFYEEPVFERPADQPFEQTASDVERVDEHYVEQAPTYEEPTASHVEAIDESWPPREETERHGSQTLENYHQEEFSAASTSPEPIGLWPTSDVEEQRDDAQAPVAFGGDDYAAAQAPQDEIPATGASMASWPEQPVADTAVHEDAWQWPEETPRQAEEAWRDVPDLSAEAAPAAPAASESVEAHFEEQTYASASSIRMPSTEDFPAFEQATIADDLSGHQFGGDNLHGATAAGSTAAAATPSVEKDPWEDIEGLIGYNQNAMPQTRDDDPARDMDGDSDMMPPPARPYRVAPKKRNYTAPILALIGLIIVAAGGYALWLNQDALSELVGLGDPAPVTAPANEAAQAPAETAQPPASNAAAPANPATAEGGTTRPAAEEVAATNKFTQRLLPNGNEVDEGAGPAEANGAGQSVAQLNAPPAAPAEAAGAAGAASEAGPAEPSATPADAAALSGEKMFLYEERVGQTAPTAIEGAVAWSLQREANANGVQEPVVQGRVNVPGRGLTALITFKRNTDASLPASHLVEIVFAVPPGFEGGAIDSVQRLAMKQTEQDRGDALIAVPAKITDDFHMIALNDFPDARATNMELLRSRNWMDVPLAYRNGRRALLTLQKGEEGTRAFNEAIREWQALSNNGNTGQ